MQHLQITQMAHKSDVCHTSHLINQQQRSFTAELANAEKKLNLEVK